MKFKDRYQAGQLLAQELLKYEGENGIVLGIPRGGVVIGYPIANALDFPLDVILSKKIGHPMNKEPNHHSANTQPSSKAWSRLASSLASPPTARTVPSSP